jgi:PDZ domain
MNRSLSLGGGGLLVLVFTAGMAFGHPPHHTPVKPAHTPVQPNYQKPPSFHTDGGKKDIGPKDVVKKDVVKKDVVKNNKTGKKKVEKKSGNSKKNKKHKKHHKHRPKAFAGGDDDSADGGADDDGDDPEVESGTGLQITDLDEAGPAMEVGLDVDDTIVSVNGLRVKSVLELRAVVEKATSPVRVVFLSDETGNVEEVDITPKNGRLGITMEEVNVN